MDRRNCVCYLKSGSNPVFSDLPLSGKEEVLRAMSRMMMELDREIMCVIHLDKRMLPMSYHVCSIGTINVTLASPRESFKSALLEGASYILMLHNHPSGDPSPSQADINLTKKIIEAGRIMDIPLVDHTIIGHMDNEPLYASIRADYDQLWEMPEPSSPSWVLNEVSIRVRLSAASMLHGRTPQECALEVLPSCGGIESGHVGAAFFDTRNRLIKLCRMPKERAGEGSTRSRIMRDGVINNAAYLVLFTADYPRIPEKRLIRAWAETGEVMDIPLMDAIAVRDGGYISAREQGSLPGLGADKQSKAAEKMKGESR